MRREAEQAGLHISVWELLHELSSVEETVLLYYGGTKGWPGARRMFTDSATADRVAELFGTSHYAPRR